MNIAVCVKQIPDPANPYSLDEETHLLVRPEDQVLDDTDRYGVEMGLQMADADEDSTVTLISMGPSGSMQGIRQALAMGATNALVITDPALTGSGALATARVLAAAIKRNPFDMVICGTESTDGYSTGVASRVSASRSSDLVTAGDTSTSAASFASIGWRRWWLEFAC